LQARLPRYAVEDYPPAFVTVLHREAGEVGERSEVGGASAKKLTRIRSAQPLNIFHAIYR